MYIRLLFALFLFIDFSKAVEVCYKGYYIFFPIIIDCINYKTNKISAVAYSTPFGSLFKKVRYEGFALYDKKNEKLASKEFFFIQQENKHKYIHKYIFSINKVFYEKKHYKLKDEKYIYKGKSEKILILKETFFDPFTASLYLYKAIKKIKQGNIPIFYDGKFYKVPFKVLKTEEIHLNGKIYKTFKVHLNPKFKTNGLLKPTGNWYIWIDKNLNLPVKMKVKFTIGSFKLVLYSLKMEDLKNESE